MKTQQHYKAVKNELTSFCPVFYFLGQYLKGADNTSYKVPAIYIEMPKFLPVTYFGKIKASRNAQIKIHIINNAPYKSNDNNIQDSALQAHETLISNVNTALLSKVFKDANDRFLTNQFTEVASSNNNFDGVHVYSIITYQTDLYDRS